MAAANNEFFEALSMLDAPQFSVYTKFGIDPKTAGSSTLDADLGVRVSFAASKCLAISTE